MLALRIYWIDACDADSRGRAGLRWGAPGGGLEAAGRTRVRRTGVRSNRCSIRTYVRFRAWDREHGVRAWQVSRDPGAGWHRSRASRASLPRQPAAPAAPASRASRASRASLPRQPASLSRLGSAGRFLPDHARMPPSAMRCDSAVLTHLARRGTVGGHVGRNGGRLAPRQPASRASLPAWHRASLTAASLTAASLPASPRQPRGVADHR